MPKSTERSGFLSQLMSGKPTYAEKPAALNADFVTTTLVLSDTVDKAYKDKTKKTVLWGEIKDTFYFSNGVKNSESWWYFFFNHSRTVLSRVFKLIDGFVRLPAICFAALQIIFERGGWYLQSMLGRYFEKDSPSGTATKLFLGNSGYYGLGIFPFIVSTIGLAINMTGAIVLRFAVFASKVFAEALRMPLAIIGGVIGALYGGIVAIGDYLRNKTQDSESLFKPWYHVVFLGMLEGVRPFAPEAAGRMFLIYMDAIQDKSTSEASSQIQPQSYAPPTSWLSITMLTLAITAVIVFSTVTVGFDKILGTHLDQPLLKALFDLTHVAEGGKWPFGHITFMKLNGALSATTFTTFTLMAIGGLQAALVGISRGFKAFFNDLMHQKRGNDEVLNLATVAPALQQPKGNQAAQAQDGKGVVAYAAPGVRNSINNKNNTVTSIHGGNSIK